MSRDDQGVLRAAHDGLGVVDHLRHRDPHGRLVAEDDLAERIADEEHRDAGLVEELGGRVVVGGQHRDALAVGVQLGDVDDGQAADGLGTWRSCRLPQGLDRALSLRGGVALVQRDGDPVEQARRRRRACSAAAGPPAIRRRPGSRRGWCRSRSPSPARPRRSRRAGRRPCAGACRRPARASRSRRRTRPGPGPAAAARAWRRRRCRGRGRSGRPRRGGPASTPARGSGRRRAGAWCSAVVDRPEVGDGRGHHQRVEAGGAVGPVGDAQQRSAQVGGRLDPDDRGRGRQRRPRRSRR